MGALTAGIVLIFLFIWYLNVQAGIKEEQRMHEKRNREESQRRDRQIQEDKRRQERERKKIEAIEAEQRLQEETRRRNQQLQEQKKRWEEEKKRKEIEAKQQDRSNIFEDDYYEEESIFSPRILADPEREPPIVESQPPYYQKVDYQAFRDILQENRITKLYHFTDRANIKSIKEQGGLVSWWYCQCYDIDIPYAGGDDTSRSLDRRYGLQDYVRLSFTPSHPMMYVARTQGRIKDPVVLEIDPEVCLFRETKFSDMNATRTGHNCGDSLEDFKKIKFAVVKQHKHFDLSDEDKPYYQAEVLVKTQLPIQWIKNINSF